MPAGARPIVLPGGLYVSLGTHVPDHAGDRGKRTRNRDAIRFPYSSSQAHCTMHPIQPWRSCFASPTSLASFPQSCPRFPIEEQAEIFWGFPITALTHAGMAPCSHLGFEVPLGTSLYLASRPEDPGWRERGARSRWALVRTPSLPSLPPQWCLPILHALASSFRPRVPTKKYTALIRGAWVVRPSSS